MATSLQRPFSSSRCTVQTLTLILASLQQPPLQNGNRDDGTCFELGWAGGGHTRAQEVLICRRLEIFVTFYIFIFFLLEIAPLSPPGSAVPRKRPPKRVPNYQNDLPTTTEERCTQNHMILLKVTKLDP